MVVISVVVAILMLVMEIAEVTAKMSVERQWVGIHQRHQWVAAMDQVVAQLAVTDQLELQIMAELTTGGRTLVQDQTMEIVEVS